MQVMTMTESLFLVLVSNLSEPWDNDPLIYGKSVMGRLAEFEHYPGAPMRSFGACGSEHRLEGLPPEVI